VNNDKKYAFTMLELVFVIVVAGILAATMIPRFDRDNLQEAADQVISHIRYTQHLAMIDDKFDANNAVWYKERWQLLFGQSAYTNHKYSYSIFSDKDTYAGGPGIAELAKNPLNPNQLLTGGYSGVIRTSDKRSTKAMNIGETYGINDVKFIGCGSSSSTRIAFDYLGRPIGGDLSTSTKPYQSDRLLKTQCRIALCKNNPCDDKNVTIAIEPETGYVHIL